MKLTGIGKTQPTGLQFDGSKLGEPLILFDLGIRRVGQKQIHRLSRIRFHNKSMFPMTILDADVLQRANAFAAR